MKAPLAAVILTLAACAAPPPPPPADHAACAKTLRDARIAALNDRIALLDELVTAHQARFDAEPIVEKKARILEQQKKAVIRMIETRNELIRESAK